MSDRFVVYLSILIAVCIIGVIRFKKLSPPFKILTLTLVAAVISEATSRILIRTIENSNPAYHLFVLVHYTGYAFIYAHLARKTAVKKAVKISVIPFITLSLANSFYFGSVFTFPSTILILAHVLFFLFALLLFIQMLQEDPSSVPILKQSVFWMNAAILIYSAAIPLNFGLVSYFLTHEIGTAPLHSLIYYITVSFYLVLGYSLTLDLKQQQSHESC